jgi:hypothetical protein
MKKDQREAEEVVMKVYLHKIILKKNLFSLAGFPLSGSASATPPVNGDPMEMVHDRAITRFEAGRIAVAAMGASV